MGCTRDKINLKATKAQQRSMDLPSFVGRTAGRRSEVSTTSNPSVVEVEKLDEEGHKREMEVKANEAKEKEVKDKEVKEKEKEPKENEKERKKEK